MTIKQNLKYRLLPAVHEMAAELSKQEGMGDQYSFHAITWATRQALEKARGILLQGKDRIPWERGDTLLELNEQNTKQYAADLQTWLTAEARRSLSKRNSSLQKVINATGVVLHTNCGRAPLAAEAAESMAQLAMSYNNLELDLTTGERGSRYEHLQNLLLKLTGAEAALVVNNNAAAVLLIMNTLAKDKEVIVSRGELVEVGGSFRIPEVLKAGGAKLMEVGATNKTWLQDYREAFSQNTALLLKVHTSNYRIEGFHQAVSVQKLVPLGQELGIPVVEDLGSGSFLDGLHLGLPKEPTIQETVKAGADLVTFSGDKLLGGPQAGIIVGRKKYIDLLKKNQLTRALRVDKLTIAALAASLHIYERGEIDQIPVWGMLQKSKAVLFDQAQRLKERLAELDFLSVSIGENVSCVGGGAFPAAFLPTMVCTLRPKQGSLAELEDFLRLGEVPILVRTEKDQILLDVRTLLPGDEEEIFSRLALWKSSPIRLLQNDMV